MAHGHIFISELAPGENDERRFAGTPLIKAGYIYHFNELITPAFSGHPAILEKIQEMYLLFDHLDFYELSKEDFNTAVRLIYHHIRQLQNPTEGQRMAIEIWDEYLHDLIVADPRFEGWGTA
jgi:hypothetical protein